MDNSAHGFSKINIITKCSHTNVIRDFESFFEKYVLSKDFTKLDEYVICSIDSAEVIDKKSGEIKTKFGLTDTLHLSTGCKVVLSYLHIRRNEELFKDRILDITECGYNALEILFTCVDEQKDDETIFLLRHSNQLRFCTERSYNINNNLCKNLYEGMVLYG